MSTIQCPVPECEEEWNLALPEGILTRLMDGHATHVHSVAPPFAPSPLPAAKAEKVRRPGVTSDVTSLTTSCNVGLITRLLHYYLAQTLYIS